MKRIAWVYILSKSIERISSESDFSTLRRWLTERIEISATGFVTFNTKRIRTYDLAEQHTKFLLRAKGSATLDFLRRPMVSLSLPKTGRAAFPLSSNRARDTKKRGLPPRLHVFQTDQIPVISILKILHCVLLSFPLRFSFQ
jgi:hypothetical protein